MGGQPAVFCKLVTDLHIVCFGIGKEIMKNPVERVQGIVFCHRLCGQHIRNKRCQMFCHKAKGVIQWKLSGANQKAVSGFSGTSDIDAQSRRCSMVSGIIKITGTVLSLFVITVLLQRVDNILSFFCGAKDSVFQLRVRLISGCDHCEVKTYHCHGIGNDRSTEVNQLLDRGLVQDQVKQTLIPLFVFPENFL